MLWQLNSPSTGTFYLTIGDYWLGREPDCDLFVDEDGVSRQHASLHGSRDGLAVQDQGSTNGVSVNGERIAGAAWLTNGDEVSFGDDALFSVVKLEPAADEPMLVVVQPGLGLWCLEPGEYTVGRSPDADITLDHPDVSRIHCTISFDGERFEVRDNDSSNGLHDTEGPVPAKASSESFTLWLGPCPLFLARCGELAKHNQPNFATSHTPAAPAATRHTPADDAMPLSGWLLIGMVAAILIGGAVYILGDGFGSLPRQVAEEEAEERRSSVAEQRARRTAAVVAGNTEMRSRLRELSRKSGEVRDFFRPVNNYLNQIASDLDRVTTSAFTRRLVAGTRLETLSRNLNELAGNTQAMVRDVNAFPEDLGALDNALARYQRNSSRSNLAALSGPARRTISRSERIEGALNNVGGALDATSDQLLNLASQASGWPMSSGLVSSARDSARLLDNGNQMLDEYRLGLVRYIRDVRKLEREAANVNTR